MEVEIDCFAMTFRATRNIACFVVCGLLFAACGSAAASRNAPSSQRQLEATACKLISSIPLPSPNSSNFDAISVQTSTLMALQKTNNASLKAVVRAYDNAANTQDNNAMILAINNGVKVCHRLGMRTAS
jgi:hypothetical protein